MKIFFKCVEINKPTLICIWIEHQHKSRKLRTSHWRQSKCVLGLGEIIYQSQISTCQRHRPAADVAWGASHIWWKWKWMFPMMGELHTGITYPFSNCGRVYWNISSHCRVCKKMHLSFSLTLTLSLSHFPKFFLSALSFIGFKLAVNLKMLITRKWILWQVLAKSLLAREANAVTWIIVLIPIPKILLSYLM